MKTTLLPFLLLLSIFSNAQTLFEGEIIYQNYDEEMTPIDKSIFKIKGNKVVHYIHNDKKNSIFLLDDSISYFLVGEEYKKSKFNAKYIDTFSSIQYFDTLSKLKFNLIKQSETNPDFNGFKVSFNTTKLYALDSSIKTNYSSYQLPLHNQFGFLIKAKKNITKSEYINKTTYSIFLSMTAKPIDDSEFEPE
jgi:hypothetical protein